MTITEQLRIPLADIVRHERNPRRELGDLTELAASIKAVDVLEPIVVVKRGDKYHAVTGSRRLAASKIAGKKDIPVRIVEMNDEEAAAAALVENLQREDLNPIEEATAFREWLALTNQKPADLGKIIGRSPATIANGLKLLDLPEDAQAEVATGAIGAAHGLELLRLTDLSLAVKVVRAAQQEEKRQNREEGRAKLLPTVPLRLIAEIVNNTNKNLARAAAAAAWPEQLKRRKAELEEKGITVTWRPDPSYMRDDEKPFSIAHILGAPPKKIVASGYDFTPWRSHDKDCGCGAIALIAEPHRYDEPPTLKTEDVCVNETAFRAWTRKSRGGYRSGTPRKTKEQRLKEARDQARTRIAGDLAFERRELTAKSRAIIGKLARKDLSSEASRLVLFSMTIERWWGGLEKLALWETIAAMPLAKVKQRIVGLAVDAVVPAVPKRNSGYTDRDLKSPHIEPMLGRYHITLAQADLLPKLEDARKPTPAQKAKRQAQAHERSRATQRAKARARKGGKK